MAMFAGFSASHATPTIAIDPAAARVTMAPRRKRATRPGAARSTRVSGSALGGAAFAGGSTGSVTAVPPLRLRSLDPHDLLLLAAEAQFGRAEQAINDIIAPCHAIVDELGFAVIADDEQGRRLTDRD